MFTLAYSGSAPRLALDREMADAAAAAEQMNDRIDAWVLEYLLRQPCVDLAAAASLLTTLPVPNDDAVRLATLLQALCHEISLPSLSERTLALIESFLTIHGGSGGGGAEILGSARAAYRAVVVEAVAKHLREEPPDIEGFLLAVERVWSKRGARFAARWLVSEELMELKRELLAAIGNEVVRDGLLRRDTKALAVKAVGAFLEAAERELGPPFLVSLSGAMVDNLFRMDDEFVSSVMAAASNNNDTLLSSRSGSSRFYS